MEQNIYKLRRVSRRINHVPTNRSVAQNDRQSKQLERINERFIKFFRDESDVDLSDRQSKQLKRIFERAVEVFGDESEAKLWLKEPKSALEGKAPIQLINTDLGVQQVELMLGRIEHGIFV